mmetsp:Transcript_17959/g.58149  ORF Transcript_17959/g.58149 Transcript_17959/m.58149 type:complete len:424 (+) Transcript_17959:2050-3321(+)
MLRPRVARGDPACGGEPELAQGGPGVVRPARLRPRAALQRPAHQPPQPPRHPQRHAQPRHGARRPGGGDGAGCAVVPAPGAGPIRGHLRARRPEAHLRRPVRQHLAQAPGADAGHGGVASQEGGQRLADAERPLQGAEPQPGAAAAGLRRRQPPQGVPRGRGGDGLGHGNLAQDAQPRPLPQPRPRRRQSDPGPPDVQAGGGPLRQQGPAAPLDELLQRGGRGDGCPRPGPRGQPRPPRGVPPLELHREQGSLGDRGHAQAQHVPGDSRRIGQRHLLLGGAGPRRGAMAEQDPRDASDEGERGRQVGPLGPQEGIRVPPQAQLPLPHPSRPLHGRQRQAARRAGRDRLRGAPQVGAPRVLRARGGDAARAQRSRGAAAPPGGRGGGPAPGSHLPQARGQWPAQGRGRPRQVRHQRRAQGGAPL